MDFTPAPVRKVKTGWTAEKQKRFISELAHCGCVVEAASSCNLTPRSAYELRGRAGAESFAKAWDMALQCASGRLLAHAFDRAMKGGYRRVWRDGELAVEELVPSDRMLMWLLSRIGPSAFRSRGYDATPLTTADLVPVIETFEDAMPDAPNFVWERPYQEPTLNL